MQQLTVYNFIQHNMTSYWFTRDSVTRWTFFLVHKTETVLFEWALMAFTIFSCLWRKSKMKFLLVSITSRIINVKFLPVSLTTIYKTVKYFRRIDQKLHINFLLEQDKDRSFKTIWKPFAHGQKVLIWFCRPSKKIFN
jgi:hypothetical protein